MTADDIALLCGAHNLNPEHVAYLAVNERMTREADMAAEAFYPWNLPFDLWAAEAGRYLEQLGVPRYALMEHFRREGTPPLLVDIAAEYLGLTPRERTIITGDAPEPTREMWGLRQPSSIGCWFIGARLLSSTAPACHMRS